MAVRTTSQINDLPDSAFAVILPGGKKDDQGKTTPRSLRKLPYKNADGSIDKPHLRNALARLNQTDMPAAAKERARRKLEAAARQALPSSAAATKKSAAFPSSKTITMLSGLTTAELTLTKRGANNRRFALTKGGVPMDPEVLQALIGTPAEGEAQFLETLKSQGVADQERIDAAVASYRIQKGMKDLVDDEVMAAVAKSAGYEGTAKAVTPNEGKDDKKPSATSGKPDPKAKQGMGPTKKSVDLSGLDDATKAQVEAIFKSHAAMEERADQLEAVVKSMQDEKLEAHYVAKAAKSYAHIPLGERQIGLMLKSAHDKDPEFAKGFEELLGRMDELVEKSAMLTTMGAVQKMNSGGAWDKIQALADGIVQKSAESGKSMTNQQAIDLVLKSEQGKALYREYLGDNPRQRAEIY